MTPRRKQHLDFAATLTKWTGIAAVILTLLKQVNDVRASNQALAGSVATVVGDNARESQTREVILKRLGRVERRLGSLEGRERGSVSSPDAPATTNTPRTTNGLMQVVTSPIRGAWRFLFGG
jgi:hypothetical protein